MKRKREGYDSRLDESLGRRKGAERKHSQSYKDRRHESKGMEKSSGHRSYGAVHDMDEHDKKDLNHHMMAAHHNFMEHHHRRKLKKK